jgi:hypothetical protein
MYYYDKVGKHVEYEECDIYELDEIINKEKTQNKFIRFPKYKGEPIGDLRYYDELEEGEAYFIYINKNKNDMIYMESEIDLVEVYSYYIIRQLKKNGVDIKDDVNKYLYCLEKEIDDDIYHNKLQDIEDIVKYESEKVKEQLEKLVSQNVDYIYDSIKKMVDVIINGEDDESESEIIKEVMENEEK